MSEDTFLIGIQPRETMYVSIGCPEICRRWAGSQLYYH